MYIASWKGTPVAVKVTTSKDVSLPLDLEYMFVAAGSSCLELPPRAPPRNLRHVRFGI